MENKKIATRESYGNALAELGKTHENLVVLDADLAEATKTAIFRGVFPERHIDCGIAECNMIGIAAGLAASGKVPFASSFAMFAAGRAFEQVRNSVGYPHLNVKIAATHAGISVGEDGATHQCNEDIALMRTIPGMTVICPSDDVEAKDDYHFELGKGITLREGTDLTIVSTGLCVPACLDAARALERDGISAGVINIHTIKPIDEELLIQAAKRTGKVVTVEEHSVIGGLGSAVADVLSENYPVPVHKIGIRDVFGESGPAQELLKKYGLDAEGIEVKIRIWLSSGDNL